MKRTLYPLLALLSLAPAIGLDSPDPAERRMALVELAKGDLPAALAGLEKALRDGNLVVRRTALRSLAALGKPAVGALRGALANEDAEVRAAALRALQGLSAATVKDLAAGQRDGEPAVRLATAQILLDRKPYSDETRALLELIAKDEAPAIRDLVAKAVWPFYKPTSLLRHRVVDLVIRNLQSIPLPLEGWKLRGDPQILGHKQKWFLPGLDDSAWKDAGIGKFWGDFGTNYIGHAWYRGRFTLGQKPSRFDSVELDFGAVDECAWVWVNGEYAGQHDLGPIGWDQAFQLEVTPLLKWGTENQITVRVLNAAFAGGIYKPVTLQVLKVGN